MTAALISLLLGSTIRRSIVPTSLPSAVRTLAPSSTRIGCLLSFPMSIAYFTFGNIYAILVLGCVVSICSAYKMNKAMNEDRDGEGKSMEPDRRLVALVTGGSRGVGAATALALADRGYDVLITYRNKAARAGEVANEVRQRGVRARAVECDVTKHEDRNRLFALFAEWSDHLDLLVLNASGGLERDLVAADPQYPMHINHDAQLALLDGALPLMPRGATVIFVTSHWAHRYGEVEQFPAYTPVAASKHAGEQALRRAAR